MFQKTDIIVPFETSYYVQDSKEEETLIDITNYSALRITTSSQLSSTELRRDLVQHTLVEMK